MTVGFNTFFTKIADVKFIVKNITTKAIKIMGQKIDQGKSYDLMSIPYVSEADIKHSILKGILRNKMNQGEILITDSNINLVQYNTEFIRFMQSNGLTTGVRDHFLDEIVITDLIELPTPINNVITLSDDNILYKIRGQVNLGVNRIVVTGGNIQVQGRGPNFDALITLNSDPLLEFTKGQAITITDLVLTNPLGMGLKINGQNLPGSISNLRFTWFINCNKAALFEDMDALLIQETAIIFCFDGCTMDGVRQMNVAQMLFSNNNLGSATGITIPAGNAMNSISIHNSLFLTGVGQTGLNVDPSVTLVDRGVIHNNIFDGGGVGTSLAGITKKELKWWFTNNAGIVDSRIIGSSGFSSDTPDEIEITNQDEWTLVDSIQILSSVSERFSIADGYSLMYDGYFDHQTSILGIANVRALGGNSAIKLGLAINGIISDDSVIESTAALSFDSFTLNLIAVLEQDDEIALYIQNTQSTSNFEFRTVRLTAT